MEITEKYLTFIDFNNPKHLFSEIEDLSYTLEEFNAIVEVRMNEPHLYEALFKVAMN